MLIFNIVGFIDFSSSDEIADTVSYSTIAKLVMELAEKEKAIKTLELLSAKVALECLQLGLEKVWVRIEKSHALLHAETAGIEIVRRKTEVDFLKACLAEDYASGAVLPNDAEDCIFIKDLLLTCIIGVNPHERCDKQKVVLNIKLLFKPRLHPSATSPEQNNYQIVARKVSQFVESSDYKTIEAMAIDVCDLILLQCQVSKVTCKIEKPSALMFATASGVQITRSRALSDISLQSQSPVSPQAVAYLAVGTNLGERVQNINRALQLLKERGVDVMDTSFLYETDPMYVEDQPKFLNAAIKVKTTLSPQMLLALLKQIETDLGRDFGQIRNGPRVIDLDILFYEHTELVTDTLIIPHPRLHERLF
ncbi:trifunctional dihydropteroate synthetase, partial [Kappamyces sp. JEL0680]